MTSRNFFLNNIFFHQYKALPSAFSFVFTVGCCRDFLYINFESPLWYLRCLYSYLFCLRLKLSFSLKIDCLEYFIGCVKWVTQVEAAPLARLLRMVKIIIANIQTIHKALFPTMMTQTQSQIILPVRALKYFFAAKYLNVSLYRPPYKQVITPCEKYDRLEFDTNFASVELGSVRHQCIISQDSFISRFSGQCLQSLSHQLSSDHLL